MNTAYVLSSRGLTRVSLPEDIKKDLDRAMGIMSQRPPREVVLHKGSLIGSSAKVVYPLLDDLTINFCDSVTLVSEDYLNKIKNDLTETQ